MDKGYPLYYHAFALHFISVEMIVTNEIEDESHFELPFFLLYISIHLTKVSV